MVFLQSQKNMVSGFFFPSYNEHGIKFKYKEQHGNDKHQIQKNGYLWHKEGDIKLVKSSQKASTVLLMFYFL